MIDFNKERWETIKADYDAWWQGDLKRPLLQIRIHDLPPNRPMPALPYHNFTSLYDLAVPAADVVDAMDYYLSCVRYAADGFPCVWSNFGPGVIAAFMGCRLENGNDTVWFHPPLQLELDELFFQYDDRNVWLNRIKDIQSAAMDRWQGLVQMGMTDLGGNLDILSSFRPGERLLYDLYDNPETVRRLTWRAHEMWWKYFDELDTVLRPVNPGYTAWCPIFSTKPYYMLQCDFSYMIGPDMFDEFVKPELAATCRRLGNAFYHLDGPGQLPHLDSLLAIPELRGIQWVPGAGVWNEDQSHRGQRYWPEVYHKIHKAGKLIQIYEERGLDVLDVVAEQIGTAEGIIIIADVDNSRANEVEDFLGKWYK